MKTTQPSLDIYDMINRFDLKANHAFAISDLLDILQALNSRMDAIEANLKGASDTAGCIASGIQPD